MTSQNEKKEENRRVFLGYLNETINARLRELEKDLANWQAFLDKDRELLKEAKGSANELRMMTKVSMGQTDVMWTQNEIITTYIVQSLFLRLMKMLHDEDHAGQANDFLEIELERAKKNLDDHIAKRLGQLFGKDGEGYIG